MSINANLAHWLAPDSAQGRAKCPAKSLMRIEVLTMRKMSKVLAQAIDMPIKTPAQSAQGVTPLPTGGVGGSQTPPGLEGQAAAIYSPNGGIG